MYFTAHISQDRQRRQSVKEHTEGTVKYAVEYGKRVGLENTARLQAVLHDFGKLCKDFDDYINERNQIRKGEIDHAYAGAKYLYELAKNGGDKEGVTAAKFISRTILSHHGLHDWLEEHGTDYFQKRVKNTERYEEIKANSKDFMEESELSDLLERSAKEISAVLAKCKAISQNDDVYKTQYLFYGGMTERLMQSILIDADRSDTADFMNGRGGEKFDGESIRAIWNEMDRRLCRKYEGFSKSADPIDIHRTEIAKECLDFADHEVGICRLIVPTGGGKTLSSLRFAVRQCKKFRKEKIFYIAPFMSILEQNSDVIREIAGAENFLEHYTDFEQQIESENDLNEYELRTEKWDPPVISTTLVQFLNTIFSDRSASVRRFHRLCNSVIMIDEVQAIPVKCVNLFNLAVNFLSKICRCTVVLCTATQPALNKTEYPVLLDENQRDMVADYDRYFEKFRRTAVVDRTKTEGYSYEQAAEFCAEQFGKNGDLLFVVNTKNAASTVYAILKEKYINTEVEVLHLSTGMCPQHRRAVLDRMRKGLQTGEKIICVTTQLIEAGVDISFRCVVRSFAGLDNIAQAAGRCNRNGKYPCCDVYIINLKAENLRHLPEIENKQKCTGYVVCKNKYKDLLSVDAVKDFFEQFYYEQNDQLSYKVKLDEHSTDLVNLLSVNSNRKAELAAKYNLKLKTCQGFQAFRSAGKLFQVIDSRTEPVIAPYNEEARELILDLNSHISFDEMSKKLRAAQKYTLSLYSSQVKRLEKKGCIEHLECGAMALMDGFYDAEGVGLYINGEISDGIFY